MTEYHRTLTDPSLHEPKGISTAPNETVYVSNGSGTGIWTPLKTVGVQPAYGRLSLVTNTTAFTLTNQNTWYESGLTHDKLTYNLTSIAGTERLLIPYQGAYRVSIVASVTHAVGSTIEIGISPVGAGSTTLISASCPTGVITNIAYDNIIEYNLGAALGIYYRNFTGAGASLTVKHVVMSVEMVRKA